MQRLRDAAVLAISVFVLAFITIGVAQVYLEGTGAKTWLVNAGVPAEWLP